MLANVTSSPDLYTPHSPTYFPTNENTAGDTWCSPPLSPIFDQFEIDDLDVTFPHSPTYQPNPSASEQNVDSDDGFPTSFNKKFKLDCNCKELETNSIPYSPGNKTYQPYSPQMVDFDNNNIDTSDDNDELDEIELNNIIDSLDKDVEIEKLYSDLRCKTKSENIIKCSMSRLLDDYTEKNEKSYNILNNQSFGYAYRTMKFFDLPLNVVKKHWSDDVNTLREEPLAQYYRANDCENLIENLIQLPFNEHYTMVQGNGINNCSISSYKQKMTNKINNTNSQLSPTVSIQKPYTCGSSPETSLNSDSGASACLKVPSKSVIDLNNKNIADTKVLITSVKKLDKFRRENILKLYNLLIHSREQQNQVHRQKLDRKFSRQSGASTTLAINRKNYQQFDEESTSLSGEMEMSSILKQISLNREKNKYGPINEDNSYTTLNKFNITPPVFTPTERFFIKGFRVVVT